ncbi:hypothetical protein ANACAC_01391 [Anaerostipes caccae L1-92]|uniref:Uncharacterized protein n=1 Tax=Anaerostipes caccae (strain DSM 14662 / CCUG 47493 / JCM 13470 / NCIMB 13811 / L1-92) TaxID=411490 RepID=B0MCU9_ANACD|nr:hypothetical protein ANACAC_01391 [Anaerostipes caccae L1-92]
MFEYFLLWKIRQALVFFALASIRLIKTAEIFNQKFLLFPNLKE